MVTGGDEADDGDSANGEGPTTAPALITGGMTPDAASPEPDEPAGPDAIDPDAIDPDPCADAPRPRGLARITSQPMWVLGLVVLVDEADKNIIRGLITPLKDDFGVNDFEIGILLSLALLFNGIITVPAGYLADRWNRTRAIGTTVVGWSGLTAAGALSVGFPMLVGMRAALGFGQAITEPSAASVLGDHYPPETRGRAFSIQQLMLFVGTGVGIGAGGLIGATLGWRPALVIMALPGLFVAVLVFRMREPRRGSADMMAAIGAGPVLGDDGEPEAPKLMERGFRAFLADMASGLVADMRTILRIRTMRYALVGVAGLLFTVTAVASWLGQFYERQLGVNEGIGELWVGLLAIAGGVPGVLLGGRAADRWSTKITGGRFALPAVFLCVGVTLFGAGLLLRPDTSLESGPLGFEPSVFVAVLVVQLVGFGITSMAIPGLRAGLTDAVPAHLRGAGFGAFNLVAVVFGQAAAPLVVAALSNAYDENLRTAFLLVLPFSYLGAAVLYRARKFIDEDMAKIMMAVLTALQEEKERTEERAAELGRQPS